MINVELLKSILAFMINVACGNMTIVK
jgi:hypothetical protein